MKVNIQQHTFSIDLQIDLASEDYKKEFESTIKKKAQERDAPGFRKGSPGHVQWIKQRIGQPVLKELIRAKVTQEVQDQIFKHKWIVLEGVDFDIEDVSKEIILGQKKEGIQVQCTLDVVPDFEIKLSKKDKIKGYEKPVLTDKDIDEFVEKKRHAFARTDEPLAEVEQGARISWELSHPVSPLRVATRFASKEIMDILEQVKLSAVGHKVQLTPELVIAFAQACDYMPLVSDVRASKKENLFTLELTAIERTVLPDLDQLFFERVFPGEGITTIEKFRQACKERKAEEIYSLVDYLEEHAMREALLETHEIKLPEKYCTTEENKLKWNVFKSAIEQKGLVEISSEDVFEEAKKVALDHYGRNLDGLDQATKEMLVLQVMEKYRDFFLNEGYKRLKEKKILGYIRSQITIEKQSVAHTALVKKLIDTI